MQHNQAAAARIRDEVEIPLKAAYRSLCVLFETGFDFDFDFHNRPGGANSNSHAKTEAQAVESSLRSAADVYARMAGLPGRDHALRTPPSNDEEVAMRLTPYLADYLAREAAAAAGQTQDKAQSQAQTQAQAPVLGPAPAGLSPGETTGTKVTPTARMDTAVSWVLAYLEQYMNEFPGIDFVMGTRVMACDDFSMYGV